MSYLIVGNRKSKIEMALFLPPPVYFDPTALPPAHVEGHDGDLYPLGGLTVHLAQLQPVMVLLPPQIQHLSGHKHGTFKIEFETQNPHQASPWWSAGSPADPRKGTTRSQDTHLPSDSSLGTRNWPKSS